MHNSPSARPSRRLQPLFSAMQRRKDCMSLAYRVFQGCSQGSLRGCQLGSLADGQASLVSLALQQAKQLKSTAPSAANHSSSAAVAKVWALPLRRLVTAPTHGSAAKASANAALQRQGVHLRQQLHQQRSSQVLQRSFASEAAAKASQPAPRSRKLQGQIGVSTGL